MSKYDEGMQEGSRRMLLTMRAWIDGRLKLTALKGVDPCWHCLDHLRLKGQILCSVCFAESMQRLKEVASEMEQP